MQRINDTVTDAGAKRVERPPTPHTGEPGPEDAMLATYIADCEDRLVRQELRLTNPTADGAQGTETGLALERIDALLLGATSPTGDAYAEALRMARSLTSRWRAPPRGGR
jgi:hypothetical protein